MKNIILVFIFLSSITNAQVSVDTPNWPSQLFSVDKVYQSFLRPFQSYFRDINRDYVVINSTPKLRIIRHSRFIKYYFKILIQRTITENGITEVINYSVQENPSGRILIKRTGKNLLPTSNEDLFNFKLPAPNASAEKFQLIFDNGLGLKMNFSTTGNLLSGTIDAFDGSASVLFSESQRDSGFFTRSIWFICSEGCDSTSLIANAQKTDTGEWQYLYKTSKGGQMTSQDFYSTYSNYYAPPLTSFFESILKHFTDDYDWP